VCEVAGWGYQLPALTVLAQMRDLGLTATEFGPDGFLPADPAARAAALREYGLAPVGGFVPVLLHDPVADPLGQVRAALADFTGAGAQLLVLAAATGRDDYDGRPELDAAGWATLLGYLDQVAALAADAGLIAALHPHVGTLIERPDEVRRVLDGCAIGLCLDSGHLLIGGSDPAALARTAAGRVAHVHLKDVNAALATRVRDGSLSYTRAVAAGLYRPLGAGDAGIAALVAALRDAGYDGWYVLEQDTMLAAPPGAGDPGPAADVEASLAYLRCLP
jgi:inosose dehydratase